MRNLTCQNCNSPLGINCNPARFLRNQSSLQYRQKRAFSPYRINNDREYCLADSLYQCNTPFFLLRNIHTLFLCCVTDIPGDSSLSLLPLCLFLVSFSYFTISANCFLESSHRPFCQFVLSPVPATLTDNLVYT